MSARLFAGAARRLVRRSSLATRFPSPVIGKATCDGHQPGITIRFPAPTRGSFSIGNRSKRPSQGRLSFLAAFPIRHLSCSTRPEGGFRRM